MSSPAKEHWNSRFGVILAVTGSAVGLGNFLRFPGLASQYEGGIFMIPYFISLLLIGLPLAWAEWAMGRHGGTRGFNSTPGVFRLIWRSPLAPYLGVIGVIVPLGIYMYYVFIEAWCLGYAWHYLTGALSLGKDADAYGNFFATFTGIAGDGSLFQAGHSSTLIFLGICILANFYLIYRGLSKGIEIFCLWAMPLLVLIALVILIRVLTLGTPDPAHPELNVLNGLGYMWNPQVAGKDFWVSLLNAEMWLKAAGQIFFTLSLGFGVIITYASYLKKEDDIALSSTTAVAGNEFCEVSLGGMITIPAAFVFLGAAGAAGSTFGLGFKTLPMVFAHMPGGQIFGFLFFFLLFLAAITSSISMLQPAIAFLEEGLDISRKVSVFSLVGITLVGNGVVVYFSGDATALGTLDFWVGTFFIFLLATIQTLLFGWALGVERGMKELRSGAGMSIPTWLFIPIIKYFAPGYLLAILLGWLATDFRKEFANSFSTPGSIAAMILLGLTLALFLALIHRAVQRWQISHPLEKIEA